jgi:proline-rich protein PRCC
MDLLAGYGSEDDDSNGPQHDTRLGHGNSPLAGFENITEPAVKEEVAGTLEHAQPAAQKRTNARPLKKRKTLIGKFSCGVDYGDISDVDTDDEIPLPRKKVEAAPNGNFRSIISLLPPPVASTAGAGSRKDQERLVHSDDDEVVPGAEDPTAMFLGAEQSDASEDVVMGRDARRQGYGCGVEPRDTPAGIPPNSARFGGGDTARYGNAAEFYNLPGNKLHPAMPTDASLLAALGSEAAGSGGIKFKEISGAKLRVMEPGVRAEHDALRSALGSEYESKLRADAARVGGVSKLAKRRHQLSSLYVQAKEQELDDLEKRATGMKTKAETHRKYGW